MLGQQELEAGGRSGPGRLDGLSFGHVRPPRPRNVYARQRAEGSSLYRFLAFEYGDVLTGD
jgi:hypothetical protein